MEPRFRGAGKRTLKLQICTANFFIRQNQSRNVGSGFFSCKIRKTDLRGILKLKMFMAPRRPPGGSRRALGGGEGEPGENGKNGECSYIALGRSGENWARGRLRGSVGVCAEGRGGSRGQPRAQRSRKGPEQRRADIFPRWPSLTLKASHSRKNTSQKYYYKIQQSATTCNQTPYDSLGGGRRSYARQPAKTSDDHHLSASVSKASKNHVFGFVLVLTRKDSKIKSCICTLHIADQPQLRTQHT